MYRITLKLALCWAQAAALTPGKGGGVYIPLPPSDMHGYTMAWSLHLQGSLHPGRNEWMLLKLLQSSSYTHFY